MPFNWQYFDEFPVIGILRGIAPEDLFLLAAAAADAGLRNLEITMNTRGAPAMIRQLASEFGDRMNIGAGTVCTMDDLDLAEQAGATFIVMPILNLDVVRACKYRGLAVVPGAFTPTEIYTAWKAGADLVKVFPANDLGPGFIKALRGPLEEIRLVPTGGVCLGNIKEYQQAGAVGYGIGSLFFHRDRIAAKDWDWIGRQVREFKEALGGP